MSKEKIPFDEAKGIEEIVRLSLEEKSELYKAIVYRQLHAEGMNLEKAKKLKRQAGLTE